MLSNKSIHNLIESKELILDPYFDQNIRGCGILLHLGEKLRKLKNKKIDLRKLENLEYEEFKIAEEGYLLESNEMILAQTLEKIKLPKNIAGWIETRGTIANTGLQVHLCDAHIDPESDLNITL